MYDNPKRYCWIDGKYIDITAVKSFIKDESYPDYKHSRSINSRTDAFKVLCGPLFSVVDKILFKNRHFIKTVPVKDRAKLMKETFNMSMPGDATDHTSFEAAFQPPLMSIEHELYTYLWRDLPVSDKLVKFILSTLIGVSFCHFRDYIVKVEARRMSGEMNTSSGNGFMNLMAVLFLCWLNGDSNPVGFVEGDDGLFQSTHFPTPEQFAELGFTVKSDHRDKLNEASFCGLVFDEIDQVVLCDPLEVVCNFGWVNRQYKAAKSSTFKALLRCKALSFSYQYPGHPIISSLCRYALRVSAGIDIRPVLSRGYISQWEREQLLDALAHKDELQDLLSRPVSHSSRLVVENVYKVPVALQMYLEELFESKTDLDPIDLPTGIFPKSWVSYASVYCGYQGQWIEPMRKSSLLPRDRKSVV